MVLLYSTAKVPLASDNLDAQLKELQSSKWRVLSRDPIADTSAIDAELTSLQLHLETIRDLESLEVRREIREAEKKELAEAERSIRKLDSVCEKMRLASPDENLAKARQILTACETLSSDAVLPLGGS